MSAEDVARNADVAMYEAKRSGRACSVAFNEAMRTRLIRHVTIESGLRWNSIHRPRQRLSLSSSRGRSRRWAYIPRIRAMIRR